MLYFRLPTSVFGLISLMKIIFFNSNEKVNHVPSVLKHSLDGIPSI